MSQLLHDYDELEITAEIRDNAASLPVASPGLNL